MEEKDNVGWAILGGFIPLVGLILYLCWKDSKPADAKMAGKGALIGVVVSVVLIIGSYLLFSCTTQRFWADFRPPDIRH